MERGIRSAGVVVLGVALVSLIFGVSQGLAEDLSTIAKEAQARYAKFEKEVKDMTIVQETVMSEPKMTSQMKMLRKGEKFRMEVKIKMQMPEEAEMPPGMGQMETIIIYDGKDTWMISSFTGKKKKLSGKDEKQYQRERNWWKLISEKAKLLGTKKIGKRECYVVEIEDKEYPFTKLWLDKKNLVLIKGESKGAEGEIILLIHSDFRKIKGDWEMPYKTEMYTDGELMATSLVKSIKINKGLSDDLFDPDKVKIKRKGFGMREMMKQMMREEAEDRLLEEVEEAIGR